MFNSYRYMRNKAMKKTPYASF